MGDKPWIKNYPPGVHYDIEIKPEPVPRILDETATRWPEAPAIQFMGRHFSYGEFKELTDKFAKGLQALGVGPGVHVGLYLPNSPHFAIAFYGILKAGGAVVNYSPLDAARVLEHKIEDSRTDLLVTVDLKALYPQIAPMLKTTRLKKLIVASLAELSGNPAAVSKAMQESKQLAEVAQDDRHLRFMDLLDNDGAYTVHPIADPKDEIAMLQYTGGTTGLPKGAMLTHGNLWAACAQSRAVVSGDDPVLLDARERAVVILPLFHIFALTAHMLLNVRMGTEMIFHVRFDPEAVLNDIIEQKVSFLAGVPTMFSALLDSPRVGQVKLDSLRYCLCGGAPLPLELAERFKAATDCSITEGWGMTETSPTGTFTPVRGMRKAGSCGMPSPTIDIRMLSLDDPTRYAPLGERGEMCIKGPNVMKGYWQNPEATAEATTFDGYFKTGDVAYMDDDGFVFIVDRTKDMILCSGYNVYPRNIEEAIYTHPSVREAVVIGIADPYRGQSPKAFVSLKEGASGFTLAELQAYLKDKLGKHEMVHALEVRDDLPKTPVGKLSKKALYDEQVQQQASAG